MAIFSKIISVFVSFFMAILNIFGLGAEEEPKFVLGENVNSNTAQVLEIYNAAVIKTDEDAPLVESKMDLDKLSVGGATGSTVAMIAKPLIKDVLAKEVFEDYDIPGEGLLTADDVVSAKSSTENGKTTVIIEVKDQTDGLNASEGSVSRAVGTFGDLESVFEELGTAFSEGGDTIGLTYTDCTVACIIDDATGEIVMGEWTYDVCFTIGYAEIMIEDIEIVFEDFEAVFSYKSVL
ncbi:MAG: hypothetical protein IKM25_06280 [Clostridia bacterium]|nr:hypothetical protein [Clostridia bacterium]